jgi:hypothetical protein
MEIIKTILLRAMLALIVAAPVAHADVYWICV